MGCQGKQNTQREEDRSQKAEGSINGAARRLRSSNFQLPKPNFRDGKRHRTRRWLALAIAAVGVGSLFGAGQAQAAMTWDANGTTTGQIDGAGAWLTANDWWNGTTNVNWTDGSDAVFGNGGTGGAVTLASAATVNSFTFNSFSGTYTLGTAGSTITLNSGLTMNAGSGNVTFSSPVTLGGAQTWTNNSGNTLTLNGSVNNSGNLLTIDGSGPTTFGAVTLSGAGGLTKNGAGNLDIHTTTTSFTGALTINGGEVLEQSMNIGSGNLTLNGGVLEDYWGGNLTRSLGAGAGQVQILGGASGFSGQGTTGLTIKINNNASYEVVWGAANEAGNGNATGYFNPSTLVLQGPWANAGGNVNFQNKIDLNGTTRTIAVNKDTGGTAGGGATISGAIRTSSGTAGLTKTGPGPLFLSGPNTYNGATTLSGGILNANASAALGDGSSTNTLIFNGGTLQAGGTITSPSTRGVTLTSTGLIDTNNNSVSIAGNMSGAGGLTKSGLGTLTVSGTNSYGGITVINAGTLQFPKMASLYNDTPASWTAANINVKSGGILALNLDSAGTAGFDSGNLNTLLTNISVASSATAGLQAGANLGFDTSTATGNTFTQGNAIANSTGANGGAIGVTKLGTNTLVFDKANTYTGPTTISGGTLSLTGSLTGTAITTSGSAILNESAAGVIGGAATLTQGSSGTSILSGTNTYTGATWISSGTLQISGAGSLGSGAYAANISNSGTLQYSSSANQTLSGVISGTGVLLKDTSAASTLTLSAANTFSGNTTVSAGTLSLTNALALQNSALVTTGAGAVTLSGITTPTFGGLSGASGNLATIISSGYTGSVTALNLNPISGSVTYGGAIADATTGMTLTKTGGGTQILSGVNTYTGITTIRGGTLQVGNGTTGSLNGTTGTALTFTGTGIFNVAEASSSTQGMGALTLSGGDATITSTAAGASSAATLTFASLNTRTAGATANFTLATNTTSTGATPNKIVFTSTTNVPLAGGSNDAGIFFGGSNYARDDAAGYLRAVSYSGTPDTNASTVGTGVTIGSTTSASDINLTGVITGQTTAAVNTIKTGSNLTFQATASTLNVNGFLTTATLSISNGTNASSLQTNTAGGDMVFNVTSGTTTVAPNIIDNSGSKLTKSGAGTLTLSGTNTYTGGTFINGGTVTMGAAAASLGATGSNVTFNGSGAINGAYGSVLSWGALAINGAGTTASFNTGSGSGNSMTFTGPATGNGTLTVNSFSGGYAMTFNLNSTANTFTGPIVLGSTQTSTFNANSLGDSSGAGPIQLGSGTVLGSFNYGTGAIAPLTLNYRQIVLAGTTAGGTIQNSSNQAITINTNLGISGTGAKTLTLGAVTGPTNAWGGSIADGPGSQISLTVSGGTWSLGGANAYSGGTAITGGTVKVGNATALGTGAVNVTSGAVLDLNGTTMTNTNPLTLNGTGISSGGALANSSGTAATYAGLVTLGATGTSIVANSGNISLSNTGTIAGASTGLGLVLGGTATGNSIASAFNGGVAGTPGAGTLTKQGTGTWTLTNTSTYTGATAVNVGALALGNGGNLGATAVTVASNATFAVTQNTTGASNAVGNATFTLNAGSALNMADGYTSTLNLGGAATLAPSSGTAPVITFNIASANTTNDVLAITGAATVGAGKATIVPVFLAMPSSGSNTYTLITAASGLGSANFTLGGQRNIIIPSVGVFQTTLATSTTTAEILSFTTGAATPTSAYWTGVQGNGSWTAQNGTTFTTNFAVDALASADTYAPPGSTTTVYMTANSATNLATTLDQASTTIAGLVFTGTGTTNATAGSSIGPGATSTNSLTIGTGGITVNAGSGANTISAPVVLGGAQSWTNSSGNLLTVSGNIDNSANLLTIAGSGNTSFGGIIGSGTTKSGGLTVNASGATVTLSGANAYTGVTTLTAGTLSVGASNNLGAAASNLVFNGGTLQITGTALTSFSGIGHTVSFTSGQPVGLDINNAGNTFTADQVLNQGAGGLTKVGLGTLVLTKVNTYTGGTTISGGALQISGTGSLNAGSYAGGISIANGATLRYSSSAAQTFSGVITGTGGLTKDTNTGDLTLSSTSNTYSGTTTVSSGRILASAAGILSNGATSLVQSGVGQFMLTGGTTYSNPFNISGTGYAEGSDSQNNNDGAIRIDGSNTLSGTITLSGNARIGMYGASGTNTISGQITGSYGIDFYGMNSANSAAQTFLISNTGNNYTGATTIYNSNYNSTTFTGVSTTLKLGASNVIPSGASAGNVVFAINGTDPNATDVLDLNSFSNTINGLTVSSGAFATKITNSGSGASVLTIGANNTTSSFSGTITDGGSGKTLAITKIGAGVLTLTGTNTYIGGTTVSAGTLALTGAGAVNTSSGITVNGSGATFLQTSSAAVAPTLTLTQGILTGSGTVNTVNVGAGTGGNISNNNGLAGAALTIGTLTLAGGANINLFSNGASTTADLTVTTLTNNSAANAVTITANNVAGWTSGSTYNLISYTTLNGAGLNNFAHAVNNLSSRQLPTWGNSGTAITLTINGDSLFWLGGGDGNWNTAATGNWQLVTAGTPTTFLANDTVIFNDNATAAGPITVNIDAANVNPNSTTFSNSTKNYVLSSTGGFGISSGSLTKSGSGTLTINNTNTYSGGTSITGGILSFANNALGSGTITVNGGTLQWASGNTQDISGTLALVNSGSATLDTNGNTVTLASPFAAGISSSLTKTGLGTLYLSGTASTYTGGTTVAAGTLAVGSGNNANTPLSASSGLTINSGGTVQINSDNGLSGNTASNKVPVTINAGGLMTGLATADSGAGPTVNIYGVLNLNGGTLANGGTGAQTAYGTWDLAGGVTVNGGTNTSTISASNVVPNQTGGTTFTVANGGTASGMDLNVTGSLIKGTSTADTGIIKTGAGTMALAGANTYTGGTTVSAGTLLLASSGSANAIAGGGLTIGAASNTAATVQYTGTSSDMMGAGAVTINGRGILDFNGATDTIGNVTLVSTGATTSNPTPLINTAGGGNLTIGTLGITPVAGFTSVVNSGTGTLTLGGNVTFTTATTGQAQITGQTLALGATRTITFSGTAGTGTTYDMDITSAITGATFGLTTSGTGRLQLDGTTANTYSGLTTVGAGGTLLLSKTANVNALGSGGVQVGAANNTAATVQYATTGTSTDMIADTAPVTLLGQGSLDFNGATDTIGNVTITATGATAGSTPIKNTAGGGILTIGTLGITPVAGYNSQINSGTGTITLGGDVTFTAATTGQAQISGNLALGGATRNFTVGLGTGANQDLLVDAAISGSSVGLTKAGAGRLALSGTNSYTGPTTVSAGKLLLSGSLSGSNVATSGTGILTQGGTGAINGVGVTFTQGSSGITTLSGINTYTGATNVNAGTLLVNSPGALAAGSALTVANGATLGGNGTIGGTVNVAAGGALSPGASAGAIGTLTLTDNSASALTLNGNSLYYDLPASGTTCDLIAITGNLVLNGTNTVALNLPTAGVPANTYTLLTFGAQTGSGSLVFANGSTTLGNAALAVNAGNVQLTVGAGGLNQGVWKGTVSGVWDGGILNWTRNGTAAQAFATNDLVTFDDTATTYTVTSGGTVAPGLVTVNNSTNAYTINATIGGTGTQLIKSGTNALTLGGTNSYTGGTVLNAGTLYFPADTALGTSGNRNITFNGTATFQATTGNGTYNLDGLTINSGVNATINGMTGYTYNFAKAATGAGTLTLWDGSSGVSVNLNSTANSFTGPIVFSGGYSCALTVNSLSDGSATPIQFAGSSTNNYTFNFNSGATGPLVLQNRYIQIAGSTSAVDVIQNLNTDTGRTLTIKSDLQATGTGTRTLNLQGNLGGINEFAGVIANGNLTTLNIAVDPYLSGYGVSAIWYLSNTNNSYTGSTTLGYGTPTLMVNNIANTGSPSSLGASGAIIIGNDQGIGMASLIFTGAGSTSNRQFQIPGNSLGASLLNNGTGALTFTAATFNTQFTTSNAHTFTLGGSFAGGANTIQGTIQNNSAGTVGITKTDLSTWTLAGTSTYTGATTVNSGVLNVTGALGNTAIAVSGGKLNLANQYAVQNSTVTMGGGPGALLFDSAVAGHAFTLGGLAATTSGTGYNIPLLDNATPTPNAVALTIGNNNGSTTYAGVLSGPGGSLTKAGTGTLTLSGTNTYTGDTTLTTGTLNLQTTSTLQNSVVNMNGGTLTFGAGGASTITSVALGGLEGSIGLNLNNNATTPLAVSLTLGNANAAYAGNTINPTYAGVLSNTNGSASLTKVGSNTQTLSGANSYTGGTTIQTGALVAGANSLVSTNGAFGNASSAIVLGNGTLTGAADAPAILINGPYTVGRAITVGSGAAAAYSATIGGSNTTGTSTFSGNITLNTATANYTTTLQAATGGIVDFNTGVWTTNNKAITIGSAGNTGTVQLDNAIATSGGITVNYGTLVLNSAFTGGNMTVASGVTLSGSGSVGGATGVTSAMINGSSLTLTGLVTFNGTGNILSGTVSAPAGVSLAAGAGLANNGTLTTAGSLTLGTGAAMTNNGTFTGALSLGGGTLTGTGGAVSGATTVNGGTINLTGGTLGGTLTVTGGNWNGAGSVTGLITSTSGTFTIGSGAALTANGGLSVTGGTIAATDATSTITGNVSYTSDSSSAFAGTIAGSGTTLLLNNGAAVWTLGGTDTYTGGTTIAAGQLQLGAAGALGNGTSNTAGVSVATNAALDLNGITPTAVVALTLNGTGIGSTGALTNSSATAATYAGAITLGSTSSIGGTGAITLPNGIDGPYGLTKVGGDTLTLTGSNTYTGTLAINGGKLRADTAGINGGDATNGITLGGGTLAANTAGISTGKAITLASGGGTLDTSATTGSNFSGALTGAYPLTLQGSGTGIYSGAIGSSSGLTKAGPGTWTLTNSANSYTGGTTLTAGTLAFSNGALGGSAITFTGGTLQYATGNTQDISGQIFNSTSAITIDPNGGTVTLGSALDSTNTGGLTLAATAGTLVLGTVNNYTGSTTVNGGMLSVSNLAGATGTNDSLGVFSSYASALVLNGGTLNYTGTDVTTHRTFSLNPTGSGTAATITSTGGALNFTPADSTYDAVAYPAIATILTLAGDGAAANTLGLKLSDTGTAAAVSLVKAGSGTWILAAGIDNALVKDPGLWSGGTTISAGTLQLNASEALPSITTFVQSGLGGSKSVGNVQVSGSATLDLNGHVNTLNSLSGSGTVTSGTGNGMLALGAVGTTFGGAFSGNITGTLGVVKFGNGTLTLSGSNTYSGGTTIQTGTVVLGSATALPANQPLVMSPANNATDSGNPTLDLGGNSLSVSALTGTATANAVVPAYDHIVVEGWNYKAATIGHFGGSSSPASGGDVIELADASGNPLLPSGLLVGQTLSAPGYLPSGTTIIGIAGLYVQLSNGFGRTGYTSLTFGSTIQATLTNGSFGAYSAAGSTPLIGNSGTTPATLTVGGGLGGGSSTYAGVIQDTLGSGTSTVALDLTGTNSLTLTGNNTFTGGTTIDTSSTLLVGDGVTNGSRIAGNITNNSALTINTPDSWTYGGVISSTGTLTKAGSGNLTLSGSNTYSGVTTIQGGTLALVGARNTIAGSTKIIVGDTLANNAAVLDVTGITGGFHVVSGQTLAGHGHISGNVTIDSGAHYAPGNSIGTLDYAGGNLILGGTSDIEIDKASGPVYTNDKSVGINALTYGGTLHIIPSGLLLTTGDNWDLFDFTTQSGAFANNTVFGTAGDGTNLPTLRTGLKWEFNYASGVLSIDGTLAGTTTYTLTASSTSTTTNLLKGAKINVTSRIDNTGETDLTYTNLGFTDGSTTNVVAAGSSVTAGGHDSAATTYTVGTYGTLTITPNVSSTTNTGGTADSANPLNLVNVGQATANNSNSLTTLGTPLTAAITASTSEYVGLTSQSTFLNGSTGMDKGGTATIAGAVTAAASGTVGMAWRTVTTSDNAPLFSNVVELSGFSTNTVVLEMFYNQGSLTPTEEAALFLGHEIGQGGLWHNAGTAGTKLGAWTGDLTLGDWGQDTTNNYVWAVVQLSGTATENDFAVIPEPTSLGLLGLGALGLLGRKRRKS